MLLWQLKILKDIELEHYWGVDLSMATLQFAKTNLNKFPFSSTLVNEDLAVAITYYMSQFYIICAGYSLHYLKHHEK